MSVLRRSADRRGGFSLLEVLVVIVLLGVTAGLVIPRIVGNDDRRVRASAVGVAELLGAVARRDALASRAMALVFDTQSQRLVAQSLEANTRGDREWREDRLLPAADLSQARLVSVQADGAELDVANLRVDFDQFQPRPWLRIVLSDARERSFWSVELPPTALAAQIVAGDARVADAGVQDVREDLDAAGESERAW